jgi:hypothetical protein
MAEAHVISALRDKRAELSGQIADLEKHLGQARADLVHVDAVFRLFAPEEEPSDIAPKAVRRCNTWFRPGECPRLVLETLRGDFEDGGRTLGHAGDHRAADDEEGPGPGRWADARAGS